VIASTALVLAIAVGNVSSNPVMPPADVRHDTRALFHLGATVVCANEIAPPSYKRTFHRTARATGYRTAELSAPDPVAVARSAPWRTTAVRVRYLSRGVPGITPQRSATVVRLVDGRRLAVVICTHLVSRAWTHVEATTGLRRHLWNTAADRIRSIVHYWHRRGAAVLVVGDMNHPRPIRWARRQRVLANTGLLQVVAVPPAASRTVRLGGLTVSSRLVFTDHPLIRRRVAFVTP
jgi:hypothetical protein